MMKMIKMAELKVKLLKWHSKLNTKQNSTLECDCLPCIVNHGASFIIRTENMKI